MDALKKIFHQIGSDPRTAPTGYDIASKVTDNPALGTFLSTAIDFGAQLPGTQFLHPGVTGEIKNIPGIDNVINASELFKKAGESGPSLETKIAQMHGQVGEVRNAVPKLLDKTRAEMFGTEEAAKKESKEAFWHDPNDHSFTDDNKDYLDRLKDRGIDEEDIRSAQDGPDHLPYVPVEGAPFALPNFSAKPTGVIGEPRIQGISKNNGADPFQWADTSTKSGKQLLQRHNSLGMPAEINTSSDLISRDDYLKEIPQGSTVNMHMLSGDLEMDRIMFPGNASFKRQELAAQKLEQSGVNVNRVYPSSTQDYMSQSTQAYGPGKAGDDGAQIMQAVQSKLDEVQGKRNQAQAMKESGVIPIKPDQYAHGGTVIPHYAQGGMAGLPPGFTMDQDQSPAPQSDNPSQLPPGFTIDQGPYGGHIGEAVSGVLGALRGATLDLSDMVLTRNHDISSLPFMPTMSKEDVKGYQETNPKSSIAGEIGGVVASAALDPLSPAALIGKAGKATTGGIEALDALKTIDRTTTVGKILGATADIGAHAAGSAVEGALYSGIGNSINEYSLGDPSLNGEKVLGNFGYGALIGGALGGTLKAAQVGLPEGISAAKDGITGVRDYLFGPGGTEAGKTGVIPKALMSMGEEGSLSFKLGEAIDNRARTMTPEERTGLVQNISSQISSVYKNVESSIKKLNSVIRPAERDALINTAAPLSKINSARQDIINTMNSALKTAEERPALYDPGPVAKLEQIRDDFVGQLKNNLTPAEIHEHLIEAKQQLQSLAYTKTSSTAVDTKALIDGVWGKIREVTHDPDTFGFAGAAQAAHDEILSDHYKFNPTSNKATPFRKVFMEKDGKGAWQISPQKIEVYLKQKGTLKGDIKGDMLNEWWDHLQKLPAHLENTFQNVPNDLWDESKFSKMKDILGKAQLTFNEGAEKYTDSLKNAKGRGFGIREGLATAIGIHNPAIGLAIEAFNMATRPVETINKLAALEEIVGKTTAAIGKGAKAIFDKGINASMKVIPVATRLEGKDQVEKHQHMQKEFAQFQADPSKFADKLGGATDAMYKVAPKTAQSLQISAAKAVQFLQSKLPTKPHDNMFSAPYSPSVTEMARFERYLGVIEKPTSVLAQVRRGTIGPEAIEALNAVYPKLLDQMRQSVQLEANKQVQMKKEIPYQLKQSLSMFLGQPLSHALLPQSIMNNQMVFSANTQQQAQKNGPQKAPPKALGDMGQSGRASLRKSDDGPNI